MQATFKFGFAGPATLLVAPSVGFVFGALIVGALGVLHLALISEARVASARSWQG
jgi:hypothetical protein